MGIYVKKFVCRIHLRWILDILISKKTFRRSIQKNVPVRPHFFPKVVSHGQVFFYRPRMS